METEDSIYFYGHKNLFGFMSNFYPCTFTTYVSFPTNHEYYGYNYQFNCSEQYFMFMKCVTFDVNNIDLLNSIFHETNPSKIKSFGRQVGNYDDETWREVSINIMKRAQELKYGQNENLKQMLIETYPKRLYESSPSDKIWGIGVSTLKAPNTCASRFGTNYLGYILEEVRETYIT